MVLRPRGRRQCFSFLTRVVSGVARAEIRNHKLLAQSASKTVFVATSGSESAESVAAGRGSRCLFLSSLSLNY